jgi:hypothetical protein
VLWILNFWQVTASSENRWVPRSSRSLRAAGIFALLHYRIVAAVRKRMTAQEPPQSHPRAARRPVTLHRLHRILRAAGNITACRRENRRHRPLIGAQTLQHSQLRKPAH